MKEALRLKLEELDISKDQANEFDISAQINSSSKDDDSLEAKAERFAFGCAENHDEAASKWGAYYGPMMVWPENGVFYESPSISYIDDSYLNYWASRAEETKNYLMQARYYGLIWDLTEKINSSKPNYQVALKFINSLIGIINNNIYSHPVEAINKITIAYKVARAINNDIKRNVIRTAIDLEDAIATEDKDAGLWGFCFELFVLGKDKSLEENQLHKLISDLEERLLRVSKSCLPRVCEQAAIPLATYYRILNKLDDVKRVIDILGDCYEAQCQNQDAMSASSAYQHIYNIYLSFNFKDKAEAVSRKIAEIGPRLVESMQTFSHSTEIPKEKLDLYLNNMTAGGLQVALNRIAVQFLPLKDQVEKQVLELAKEYPLNYMLTKKIQDHEGRPVATIGSIEDDLEGNIIHHLSRSTGFDSFLLRHSLNKLIELYKPSQNDLCQFIFSSPVFKENKKVIIQKGLEAFLNNDYVTSIHLLIPQIEAAIRTVIEFAGGVTLKPNRQGGLQLRTFDDLLRDAKVLECFGVDSTFYFRALLTDQRGWNLRNDTCHGISPSDSYHYAASDRVFHILLCLAQVREHNT